MTKIIARLGAVLGFESQDFVKGVNAAQQKSKEFKQNLKELKDTTEQIKSAFSLASAAFIGFSAHAINAADEIQDLADANEVTTGKILELKHALELSGGDASKVDVLFTKFTSAINNAAQGSDSLRDSFKALGISTRDIGFLSNQQLLDKAFAGLSKVEDVTRRNALATELFGKAAKSVDFAQMSKNAEDLAGHYKDQEQAIKAAADASQKVKSLFHEIEMAAVLAAKPVLDLFNKIPTEDRVNAITKAFQALGIAIGVAFGVTAVKGVLQLAGALRTLAITNPWLLALTAAGGAAAYFGMDKLLGGGETIPEEAAPESSSAGKRRDIELSAKDKMILKYKQLIKEISELAHLEQARINNSTNLEIKELELLDKKSILSTQEFEKQKLRLQYAKESLSIREKAEKSIYDAQKQMELAPAEESAMAKKLYDEKVKYIEQTKNYELEMLNMVDERRKQNFENEYERQRSWAAGWSEAFKQYQEASEKASDRGRQAFNSVVQNMETALTNFVETGKLSFKDLIGSIIKDLMKAELRAQATSIFGMLKSSFSFFGSSPNAPIVERSFSGFAAGGYIDRPSIVGENGAELFIPNVPGTIIPNGSWQQMASMNSGSGFTNNGTYIANMSAIDTQSATQFLASNKNTIWAVYQSANRSVPISR